MEEFKFEDARMNQVKDLKVYGEVELDQNRREQIQGFFVYASQERLSG